jgi:hypothetical protein
MEGVMGMVVKISILAGGGDGACEVLQLEELLEASGDVLPEVLLLALVVGSEVVFVDLSAPVLQEIAAGTHVVHRLLILLPLPHQHLAMSPQVHLHYVLQVAVFLLRPFIGNGLNGCRERSIEDVS